MNKRSGDQSLPTPKTDWCLTLMIKSYHQEYMSWVETISKKRKKKRKKGRSHRKWWSQSLYVCISFMWESNLACVSQVPTWSLDGHGLGNDLNYFSGWKAWNTKSYEFFYIHKTPFFMGPLTKIKDKRIILQYSI